MDIPNDLADLAFFKDLADQIRTDEAIGLLTKQQASDALAVFK